MKVTNKIISIPPYISTSWASVQAIHTSDNILVVTLMDGDSVYVPGLDKEQINEIFQAHCAFLEEEAEFISGAPQHPGEALQAVLGGDQAGDIAAQLGRFGGFDGLTAVLQHNPSQAHAPDLPKEMLEKVASIAKVMGGDEMMEIPKPEPHCNCMFCQLARAIGDADPEQMADIAASALQSDRDVSEDDLRFQQWEIHQEGDQLYTVTSRLDDGEKYSVFLGEPVGCTCGKAGCEHIVAVLQS